MAPPVESALDLPALTACYNALLERDPDKTALEHWINKGGGGLQDVLLTIVGSEEFAIKWRNDLHRRLGAGELKFFNEQSQFGEIGLLLREMVNRGAKRQIVVDVGANGRERSNSYDLLRNFGWRGLLIEANPGREAIIRREFTGLDYTLVSCAVSDYAGEATFHIGQNDDVSSLQQEAAENWGPVRDTLSVAVRPLPAILDEHSIPRDFDLLTIDAEGEDVRILNHTIAQGFTPTWIIMEADHGGPLTRLGDLGLSEDVVQAYQIVATTAANLILCRR